MTPAELQAGIDANNARASAADAWRLRWISFALVPTGTVTTFQFQIPPAAAFYRLEYLMMGWGIGPGLFRPLNLEISDDRGQKFILFSKQTQNLGAKVALFTSPGVDPNPALAGDQSAYKGMFPLMLDFPGRATVTLTLRGAVGTPDPTTVNVLLAGHQQNRLG